MLLNNLGTVIPHICFRTEPIKLGIPSENEPPLTTQPKWGDVLLTEYFSYSASVFDGSLTHFFVISIELTNFLKM